MTGIGIWLIGWRIGMGCATTRQFVKTVRAAIASAYPGGATATSITIAATID
jgi:hypothetical protein